VLFSLQNIEKKDKHKRDYPARDIRQHSLPKAGICSDKLAAKQQQTTRHGNIGKIEANQACQADKQTGKKKIPGAKLVF
jgi:hypothetical protein